MGPKVEPACRFVEATGGRGAIGDLAAATEIVKGTAGTLVLPAPSGSARSPGVLR